MSLLIFLLACGFGAVVGLLSRPSTTIGRALLLGALFVAFVAALFVGPSSSLNLGDVTLAGGQFSSLFLACAAGSALLLCVVALASGWQDEFAPATLAALAGIAVATTSTDAGVALMAGAALATAGALLMVRAPMSGPVDGRLAEMRTIALVTAAFVIAAIAILHPAWSAYDGPVLAVAFIGLSLALAVRSGAVPFHVAAVHLRRSATPVAPALLLVWIPASLGLLVLSWSAITFHIGDDALKGAVAAVQVVAVATLVLGALAALVHDELEEVATYSIVADSGFLLLALASRTDSAAEPARLWLLVFIAAKTAFVAWTAAISRAYGTSSLGQLHGWLRRTPLLGLALVVVALATIGWPGSAVYGARSTLIRLGLPGQLQFLFAATMVLSVAYYIRLLAIGLLSPADAVRAGGSERPHLPAAPVKAEATEGADAARDVKAVPAADGAQAVDPAAAVPVPIVEAAAAEAVTQKVGSKQKIAADAIPVAAITAPATSASLTSTAAGPGTDETAADEAGIGPSTTVSPSAEAAAAGPSRLSVAWHLNRTLEVSLVVVLGAILAAALAFGRLGASDASRFGTPLDTAAHATPAITPAPTQLAPTPTPLPTLAPRPTAGPVTSGSPSIGPSGSAAPIKTSGPARDNTD